MKESSHQCLTGARSWSKLVAFAFRVPIARLVVGLMFVDTIAAMIKVDLAAGVFSGSAGSVDHETGEVHERMFRNDPGGLRATYWPATKMLRVEFSVSKVSHGDLAVALDWADECVARLFSADLPQVRTWRCQRVDYYADLVVARKLMPAYLAALRELRVSGWQRHAFEGQGVVWKSRGRWVKAYDKDEEQSVAGRRGELVTKPAEPGTTARPALYSPKTTLRFEVSNYSDAVRYTSERWFGCERTVDEMTRPGRALYVMARYFEQMGLNGRFGEAERELHELREAFGQRSLAGASHALRCVREHGVESYKTMTLMSKSSYYRWLNLLREAGFLVRGRERSLPRLVLPCGEVFKMAFGPNLKSLCAQPIKNSQHLWQKIVAENLGVRPQAPPSKLLTEAFIVWSVEYLDRQARRVPGGGGIAVVREAGDGAAAGPGAGVGQQGRGGSVEASAGTGRGAKRPVGPGIGAAAGRGVG